MCDLVEWMSSFFFPFLLSSSLAEYLTQQDSPLFPFSRCRVRAALFPPQYNIRSPSSVVFLYRSTLRSPPEDGAPLMVFVRFFSLLSRRGRDSIRFFFLSFPGQVALTRSPLFPPEVGALSFSSSSSRKTTRRTVGSFPFYKKAGDAGTLSFPPLFLFLSIHRGVFSDVFLFRPFISLLLLLWKWH